MKSCVRTTNGGLAIASRGCCETRLLSRKSVLEINDSGSFLELRPGQLNCNLQSIQVVESEPMGWTRNQQATLAGLLEDRVCTVAA